jgi:hypothetical protein
MRVWNTLSRNVDNIYRTILDQQQVQLNHLQKYVTQFYGIRWQPLRPPRCNHPSEGFVTISVLKMSYAKYMKEPSFKVFF